MQKTLYQILIKVYSTETRTVCSKYMSLGKLFIIKQGIIIYKIYKQDLVVWNRVSCSTNALPFGRETMRHFSRKPLDKLL